MQPDPCSFTSRVQLEKGHRRLNHILLIPALINQTEEIDCDRPLLFGLFTLDNVFLQPFSFKYYLCCVPKYRHYHGNHDEGHDNGVDGTDFDKFPCNHAMPEDTLKRSKDEGKNFRK